MMTTLAIVSAVVVVAIAAAVIVWLVSQRRRSKEIRERFGPEYERAVNQYGDEREAEDALAARAERVDQLHIRGLTSEESARYSRAWQELQTQFVDDPEDAVARADGLVEEAMQARGYPMGEFEQRAADISVHHPVVVEHYRAAHALADRSREGKAATEELRQAMVHYRALFQELTASTMDSRQPASAEVRR
jgi:hypothetical protein